MTTFIATLTIVSSAFCLGLDAQASDVSDYEFLGVPSNATPMEIKAAYRRMALKLHPDTGGSTSQFQRLGAAYERLMGPYRRSSCDSELATKCAYDSMSDSEFLLNFELSMDRNTASYLYPDRKDSDQTMMFRLYHSPHAKWLRFVHMFGHTSFGSRILKASMGERKFPLGAEEEIYKSYFVAAVDDLDFLPTAQLKQLFIDAFFKRSIAAGTLEFITLSSKYLLGDQLPNDQIQTAILKILTNLTVGHFSDLTLRDFLMLLSRNEVALDLFTRWAQGQDWVIRQIERRIGTRKKPIPCPEPDRATLSRVRDRLSPAKPTCLTWLTGLGRRRMQDLVGM